MKRNSGLIMSALAMAFLQMLTGCQQIADEFAIGTYRLFDPAAMVHAPKDQPVHMIRGSVSVADEGHEMVPNATPPRPDDYQYTKTDYVIGPTDVVNVTILGLSSPDVSETLPREVSDSGYIDMPFLNDRIKADGLTQEQLKEEIIKAYSPNILRNPQVSVSVVARRQNTFSIMGAVGRTGTYNVLRRDMRLLEALALAGDVTNPTTRYLYVFRMQPAVSKGGNESPRATTPGRDELGPLPQEVPPPGAARTAPSPSPSPTTNPDTDLRALERLLPGPAKEPSTLPAPSQITMLTDTTPVSAASAPAELPAKGPKWVFTNGKWVRVQEEGRGGEGDSSATDARATGDANILANPSDPFGWKSRAEKTDMARIIAINYQTLKNGNPLMNIVIRDNDVIQIPPPETGEFYLMGEIARPGVYSLTGRMVTLKMAVAAGGNLGGLAWPKNSLLIRRVGYNQEQVIPLDIQAIFRGEASDIFLKPDDLIAVGTDIRAPFLAVIRSAFRFSYGFGFVYDRNFASPAPVGLNSERFERW